MINYKNLIYVLACLSFSIIIGGAVYEHVAVVPSWSAALPKSLSMFQGEFGLNPGPFWQTIHPITIALLILTLIANWRSTRRINILFTLICYVVILASTAIYFVPELLELTGSPYSDTSNPELTKRALNWETLSLIRLAVLIITGIFLYLGLTKTLAENKSAGIYSR